MEKCAEDLNWCHKRLAPKNHQVLNLQKILY